MQYANNADNQPLYTIGTTARLLGVCQATLRLWERKGLIHPYRIGKNRFYSQCNLDRLGYVKELLQKDRVNIAGVKKFIDKFFCWEIKKCLTEEREKCPVFINNKSQFKDNLCIC